MGFELMGHWRITFTRDAPFFILRGWGKGLVFDF
jgi:hypothetical protein